MPGPFSKYFDVHTSSLFSRRMRVSRGAAVLVRSTDRRHAHRILHPMLHWPTVTPAQNAEKALQCERYFVPRLDRGHCNCMENVTGHVEKLMRDQRPRTAVLKARQGSSHGSVAILLRGHAFRGSSHDTPASRHAAQLECSESVQRHIVAPFMLLGVQVHAYLTVYDTVDEEMLKKLTHPYRHALVAVTTLSSTKPAQLIGLANAIRAFEDVACSSSMAPMATAASRSATSSSTAPGCGYDAVVALRLDLRLKTDLPPLLLDGTLMMHPSANADAAGASDGGARRQEDGSSPPRHQGGRRHLGWIAGMRFAWREAGGEWRITWTPTEAQLMAANNASRADMLRVSYHMKRSAETKFLPKNWMANDRVPDTLLAWGGRFTACFRMNVMLEATRGWHSPPSSNHGALNDVGHRLLWQIRSALGVQPSPKVDLNTSLPIGYLPFLGYLVRNGAFDSNPCRTGCLLNPVYDILPRQLWTVQSGMCMRPEDFVWDEKSRSVCCPSADYCCPNSVVNCSSKLATYFDAKDVPDSILGRDGWLRHFASRFRYLSRPEPVVCGPEGWGTRACDGRIALTVTPESHSRIQALWRAAPWAPENDLPEDDDNCRMPALGRCASSKASIQRDVLGYR